MKNNLVQRSDDCCYWTGKVTERIQYCRAATYFTCNLKSLLPLVCMRTKIMPPWVFWIHFVTLPCVFSTNSFSCCSYVAFDKICFSLNSLPLFTELTIALSLSMMKQNVISLYNFYMLFKPKPTQSVKSHNASFMYFATLYRLCLCADAD